MPENGTARSATRRAVPWVACAALLAITAGLVTGPVALASSSLLSCQGTETLAFQPPLTNTSRPTMVHFTINLSHCLGSGVTTGSSEGSFTVTASCLTLSVLPPAFSDTYQWNTGTSSTATYILPVETTANGTVTVTDTGTVTSGLDQGALANETTTLPQPNLTACAGRGVANLNGPYLLTFG